MNPKEVVQRFNREVIEQGQDEAYRALLPDSFVNRSAPPGMDPGPGGMRKTFEEVLRPALSGLRVEIHDQIAEGDRVSTRKTIRGKHTGPLLGVAPTGRDVAIDVIDIVRVANGQYAEHWGINNLAAVVASLKG